MEWIQFLSGLIVIVGANFGFMRFLLKGTHKEIELMKKAQNELHEENRMTNIRLDGLYKLLIEKAYGVK